MSTQPSATDAAAPAAVEDLPVDEPCASARAVATPRVEVPELVELPAVIRPYRPNHENTVRRIFRDTIVLGGPVPFDYRDLEAYERLSLDWYLDPDNHAARRADVVVVEEDGEVRGYLLACLDQPHHERWIRRAAIRWGLRSVLRLPLLSKDARRFVRTRIRDGLHAWRHQAKAPFPAHMHFNLAPQLRGLHIGHHLVSWMDQRVVAAGLPGFFGEVNVPAGRSLRAIEAAGARVVDRVPNRTLSWLAGAPVDRCIVARALAERTDAVPS